MDKLYLISRRDLAPGLEAAQIAHAAIEMALAHPELVRAWHADSNNVVLLEVADEAALLAVAARLGDLPQVLVREPDRGDEATALAVAPAARPRLRGLPLALRSA